MIMKAWSDFFKFKSLFFTYILTAVSPTSTPPSAPYSPNLPSSSDLRLLYSPLK